MINNRTSTNQGLLIPIYKIVKSEILVQVMNEQQLNDVQCKERLKLKIPKFLPNSHQLLVAITERFLYAKMRQLIERSHHNPI